MKQLTLFWRKLVQQSNNAGGFRRIGGKLEIVEQLAVGPSFGWALGVTWYADSSNACPRWTNSLS